MKTHLVKPLLILFATFSIQSCSLADGINPNTSSQFSAVINGEKWETDDVVAISRLGSFTITAGNNGDTFAIQFSKSEMEEGKTFTITPLETSNIFRLISYKTEETSYLAVSGTLTLTKYSEDKSAEAEFSFVMEDISGNQITVENGTFKAEVLL